MSGAWLLAVGIGGALIDAATGHRARRLWRGIPEAIDRRLANRCDLGTDD